MDASALREAYFFDEFVLDGKRGALLAVGGNEIALRPKSFLLLRLLVENAGRLLDHDTIMRAVWPGLIVAEEGITQCIRDIRVALGDQAQRLVKTVPKRGYIFTGGVAVHEPGPQLPRDRFPATQGRPSVAVLPFRFTQPSEEYFSAGLMEELITALLHLRSLVLIADSDVGPAHGIATPELATHADYLLVGRVRQSGDRLRVTARLIATQTRTVVWAERFDGDAAEPFSLQDAIIETITVAVESYLCTSEIEHATQASLQGLDARGLFHRALPGIWSQTVANTANSVSLLHRAVALDPGYAPASAMLALLLQQRVTQGWHPLRTEVVNQAMMLTRQALTADRSNALVLAVAGFVPTWLLGDHEQGIELSARATAVGRHSFMALAMNGAVSAISGDSDEAITRLETAMRIHADSPISTRLYSNLACAHLFARRYDKAAYWARRALYGAPDYTVSQLYLVVSLALGGEKAALKHAVADMRARQRADLPHWPGRLHLRHAWMQELLDDGLRRAGLTT